MTTRDLRRWMALCEAEAPSKEVSDVVRSWLDGFNPSTRQAKENEVLAIRDEAARYLAPRYGRLYRGQRVSPDQHEALVRGETIKVQMPRLASWTTLITIARDFAEDGGILIVKRNLRPILDIARIAPLMPQLTDEKGIPDDHLRYAAREGEVVCEHLTPLILSPKDVLENYG